MNKQEMELKKHVGTIHCSNKLSLLQRKISNVLLFNAYEELKQKEEHEISIKKLCELIDYGSHDYKTIKNALRQLLVVVLEWNILNENLPEEEEWNASTILADVGIRGAVCSYSYSPKMKKLLYSPSIYGRINVAIQARFTSSYALALYENCARYKNLQYTKWFSIAVFRQLMGVEEGMYKEFPGFKRRIIDKAVEEINSLSDLQIEPEFRRESQRAVAVRFKIGSKKGAEEGRGTEKREMLNHLEQREGSDSHLPNYLDLILQKEFGLDKKQIKQVTQNYEQGYIQQKIELIKTSTSYITGKIQNLASYLLIALKNDFQKPKSSKESMIEIQEYKTEQQELELISEQKMKKIVDAYYNYIDETLRSILENLNENEKEAMEIAFVDYLKKSLWKKSLKKYYEEGLNDKSIIKLFGVFVRSHAPEILKNLKTKEDFIKEMELI
jgi:plasmid replication initiation protein